MQQPCDDDERQGRAVSRSKGVARESGMGDGKADDDRKKERVERRTVKS